jgi:hypothetical protein
MNAKVAEIALKQALAVLKGKNFVDAIEAVFKLTKKL